MDTKTKLLVAKILIRHNVKQSIKYAAEDVKKEVEFILNYIEANFDDIVEARTEGLDEWEGI